MGNWLDADNFNSDNSRGCHAFGRGHQVSCQEEKMTEEFRDFWLRFGEGFLFWLYSMGFGILKTLAILAWLPSLGHSLKTYRSLEFYRPTWEFSKFLCYESSRIQVFNRNTWLRLQWNDSLHFEHSLRIDKPKFWRRTKLYRLTHKDW